MEASKRRLSYQPELVYVNVTDGSTTKRWTPKNKSVVRSQAMKFSRRERRADAKDIKDKSSNKTKTNSTKGTKSACPLRLESHTEAIEKNRESQTVDCSKRNVDATETELRYSSAHDLNPELLKLLYEPAMYAMSGTESLLLSHISNLYNPLRSGMSPRFILWTKGISLLMGMALSYDFVMHSMLAWSATHLSKLSGDNEINRSAMIYRSCALSGLQQAIGSFSAENSDPVLGASIVLGWQATDALTWAAMTRGTAAIKETIANSQLKSHFLEPPSAPVKYKLEDHHPLKSKSNMWQNTGYSLDFVIQMLSELSGHLEPDARLVEVARKLKMIVVIYKAAKMNQESFQRAETLASIRDLLFWTPTQFISQIHSDPRVMLLMAYLHAVSLIIEPESESIASKEFQYLNAMPVKSFYEEFCMRAMAADSEVRFRYLHYLSLLEFPLEVVIAFEAELQSFRGMDQKVPVPLTENEYILREVEKSSKLAVLESLPVGMWYHSMGNAN